MSVSMLKPPSRENHTVQHPRKSSDKCGLALCEKLRHCEVVTETVCLLSVCVCVCVHLSAKLLLTSLQRRFYSKKISILEVRTFIAKCQGDDFKVYYS